jgi:hypothetical protein
MPVNCFLNRKKKATNCKLQATSKIKPLQPAACSLQLSIIFSAERSSSSARHIHPAEYRLRFRFLDETVIALLLYAF